MKTQNNKYYYTSSKSIVDKRTNTVLKISFKREALPSLIKPIEKMFIYDSQKYQNWKLLWICSFNFRTVETWNDIRNEHFTK